MPRLKSMAAEAYAKAVAAGQPHEYDPSQPWVYVFEQSASDDTWWKREFEDDAFRIEAKIEKLGDVVDHSALVDADKSLSKRLNETGSVGPAKLAKTAQITRDRAQNVQSKDRVSNCDENGLYVTNRRGIAICDGFNKGTCNNTKGHKCAVDVSKMHRCNRCLDVTHANTPENPCNRMSSGAGNASKGAGKKGAKKGGKKGGW